MADERVEQGEQPDGREATTTLTSPMLRAMSHPVRRRLLQLLERTAPARATDLAQELGLPVNQVSFHLRSLARADLITEAPEHARDRRDRVWVPTSRSYRLTRPTGPVSAEDSQVLEAFLGETAGEVQVLVRNVLSWAADYAAGRDEEHRGAATQEIVRLTSEEVRELVLAIDRLVEQTQRRSDEAGAPDRRVWDLALVVGRADLR